MTDIDRRLKINFSTLNEKEENEILDALIDFLGWYDRNKEMVGRKIIESGKEINDVSLVDFWIYGFSKKKHIEEYLEDINVVADCYEYVRKNKEKIFILKRGLEKDFLEKIKSKKLEQKNSLRN